jgi:antitoxin component of MazEF toxin-antitoxin module
MKNRRYTVGRRPGYLDDTMPEMRISGKWLNKIGFDIGDQVELVLEERQIVIRPAVEEQIPNMVEEAPDTEIPE